MSNTVITPSNDKQYKRRDRSVSPETAQKISSSLKSYNATHEARHQMVQSGARKSQILLRITIGRRFLRNRQTIKTYHHRTDSKK